MLCCKMLAVEIIGDFINFFLQLDIHLKTVISQYGSLTYFILFAMIFFETGFVVTPFLPGDSLLFAVGTFCANDLLDFKLSFFLILIAAVIGDGVNYHIGKFLAVKAFRYENSLFFKKEYLDKTHYFYEKYGAKTIVIARFVPIVRTFAPFVAGIGNMRYSKFLFYNVTGAFLWCFTLITAGYFFGNIAFVKNNFSSVIFFIIILSIMPGMVEYIKAKRKISPPQAN